MLNLVILVALAAGSPDGGVPSNSQVCLPIGPPVGPSEFDTNPGASRGLNDDRDEVNDLGRLISGLHAELKGPGFADVVQHAFGNDCQLLPE